MNRKKYVLLFIIVVLFVFSCGLGGKIPVKQYYTLDYTPVISVPTFSKRPYPYALQIGRFEVQQLYNRLNIIYRYSPNQLQYFELERWAIRPDNMIKEIISKHLESSELTNRIGAEFFDSKPDFRIEGSVDALEKYDAGDVFYAHLAMSFKMLRVENGSQVWGYSFDERKPVYSKEMVYTVMAMSGILQSQMDIVVSQMDSLFLSLEGIIIPASVKKTDPKAIVKPDSTDSTIDDSGFEIIPEKRK